MKPEENSSNIDRYLEQSYWIIDILPKQVPASNGSQYFKVEKYFLSHPQIDDLCRKFANMLIRLSCYDDITIVLTTGEIANPHPETIERLILARKPFFVLLRSADAMIYINGEDTYLMLYNAKAELLELVRVLAASEGLFVWQPNNKD